MGTDNIDLRNEHEGIREDVGFHDFTHELLEVSGSDAGDFLDKMFVANISGASIGEGIYTTMLDDNGHILDDVIIFRMEDQMYWVSTLYIREMLDWFEKYSDGYDVEFTDIKDITTMYAVQGPKSADVLNDFLDTNIDDLAFSWIQDNSIDDIPVKVARFGFTGELGYELYFAPEYVDFVEKHLRDSGASANIMEIKSDVVLSSLPSEKGYVLMRDLQGLNPVEAGLGWTVDWNQDFVGKEALEAAKENSNKSLIGFTVDDDSEVPLEADVKRNGKVVGRVTNCTYGYTVERMIGFAVVDLDQAQIGDPVTIGDDDIEATLTDRVFYDPDNVRRAGDVKV